MHEAAKKKYIFAGKLTAVKFSRYRHLLYPALLVIVPVLAFFPVSLGLHPLKFDIMTTALPWRYHIVECLQQGILPLWNPFQHLGYPMHADPQSGAWYLPVWLLALFGPYTYYTLVFEFMCHVVLAGFGMQLLGRTLGFSKVTATLIGLAYACSGFFIGNAQHLPFLISATWVPFILAAFFELGEKRHWRPMLRLSLFLWLALSGGYPGFTIILAYLLLILFIWFIINILKKNGRQACLLYCYMLGLSAVLTLVLAAPMLLSFAQSLPFITRGDGTSLQQALACPFPPAALVSFIFPLAAVAEISRYQTDLSMTNAYMGLLSLLALLLSFTRKDKAVKWIFLLFALFCLFASMGQFSPLRAFLYHYAPLMDYFRMPGIFRLFVILGFLLAAAYTFERLLQGGWVARASFQRIFMVFFLFMLLVFFQSWFASGAALPELFSWHFLTAANHPGIGDNLLINNALLFLLCFSALLVFLAFKPGIKPEYLLLVFMSVDLILAGNLNGPYSVYAEAVSAREVQRQQEKFPAGFPLPAARPVVENKEAGKSYTELWQNLNCFYKEIGHEGYNPFSLKQYEALMFDRAAVFNPIIENPPYYLKNQAGKAARVLAFQPNHWIIEVNTAGADTLVLLQNVYPGWKVRVDGEVIEYQVYEKCFFSIPLGPGRHLVDFHYRPAFAVYAWIGSCSALLLVLGLFIPWKSWFRVGRFQNEPRITMARMARSIPRRFMRLRRSRKRT